MFRALARAFKACLAVLCLVSVVAQPAAAAAAAVAAATAADVIIIGAGMSGVAAAAALRAKGVTSVIVLEARDRLGGRISSVNVSVPGGSVSVEQGAHWIHGVTGNPLVALAKNAGVALSSKTTNYDNSQLYAASGAEVSDAQSARVDDIFSQFEDFLEAQQGDNDYADVADPGLRSAVAAFVAKKKLAGADLTAFKYALNVNYEHEYGAAISDLSLWFDGDKALPGEDRLVLGGYQQLVKFLARGVDVRLNTKVTQIDYSAASGGVVVRTAAGTFAAKRVIVTLPLGVLKANSVSFKPALPASNAKAIAALGMGLLNKCVLVFDKPFWGSKLEFVERIAAAGNGAWGEWLSLTPATGRPVLCGFNAAGYAATLEGKSDSAVVAEAMAVLRTIWPAAPPPLKSVVTRWGKDEFALGSYSFASDKGLFRATHAAIAKAVGGGRVLFAGEHTRTDYPATVHGAYLSGRSSACAVLKSLGKTC